MGGSTRTPTLTALLCLGLCWGLWDEAQMGTLPKPSIWADPSHIDTKGSRVTIWCQVSLQADGYYLYKEKVCESLETLETSWDSSNKAGFSIKSMSSHNVGRYRCAYQSGESRSQLSDDLTLVMTGIYEKPSLSTQPGASVSWGENVTLQCCSELWFDTFHLSKEGSLAPPQVLRLQDTAKPHQVNFTLSPVTSDFEGTYRCYSSHSNNPYLLSQPSDPLDLLVSGSNSQDYTVENLIRLGISALILMVLGVLLFQARHRQSRPQYAAGTSTRKREDGQ
ncbi:leukocyte immunoglobulin-like receptor subfamily A member 6 isoform X3 [Mustela nigripes]|uniref:leukocyte immunoglobulin-like receptor subfamily A member 6 isoform X3 n=1 Tax=Mustela nigripes TaxID=77151 RepID=UPI0028160258|nr:leukocyte immunoglobulin-like receptor subfamily A member 6 isoform X3 [Mustela nigripes]